GNWVSIIITLAASWFLIQWMLPETMTMKFFGVEELVDVPSRHVFYSCMIGLAVGALISMVTAYYTSLGKKPVLDIVQNSSTGAATNIIAGLAVGMKSTFFSVILFAAAIYGSYALAGFYGVALAASAMMATTAMQLAIDAFGPIADNAGGVAEMSELEDHVRERTDILDSVGNTTAAVGKGFAIASAALTALALFAAYVTFTGIDGINIFKADVLAMLFVGGMIPVIFSALAMQSVGKAAMEMVQEVRRQFREIPGIMEGKGTPEYAKCVDISTKAALKEMLLPGLITIITPIIIGLVFGAEPLGGYMAGVCVSGVMWAIFQNNAGGAWDNAKKSFEAGVEIDGEMTFKGSDAHKAAVTGDTVGDPFKDTSGPSMNILIKLTCLVGLVIAPILGESGGHGHSHDEATAAVELSEEVSSSENNMNSDLNGTYEINDSNSSFQWVGKKVTGQHSGTINAIGQVSFEEGNLTKGSVQIDMSSIKVTDIKDPDSNADLTGHLLSDDFFGVANYPTATFRLAESKQITDGVYSLKGVLNVKGKQSQVAGEYKMTEMEGKIMLEGGFVFNRAEHDIKYNSESFFSDLGDKLIYDEVPVSFTIKL
ncbi:MAG: sodium/proton-translocating pyrophosphatase, partial [Bacteroidota bacterium]